MNVKLCAKIERIFHFKGVPDQQVRAVGTEARSWVGIPVVLLAVLWPPDGCA